MSDFPATLDLGGLNGTTGFRIDGLAAGDMLGRSLVGVGDLNGDGYDDFMISAPGADPGGDAAAGSVYVVFGGASLGSTVSLASLTGANGFRLDGVTAGDLLGGSATGGSSQPNTALSFGDVDGDGLTDLIIGAGLGDPSGRSAAGYVYVVFGQSGPWSATVDLGTLGAGGFRINGVLAGDVAGYSVSAAGDINGDGVADIVIGARGTDINASNSGSAYVVFGGAGLGSDIDLSSLNGTNGFALHGATGNAGYSVTSAGDINGDGFEDLVVGASRALVGAAANSGAVYVVYGHSGGFSASYQLSALNGSDGFRMDGLNSGDWAGSAIDAGGDFNGDGIDDLLVGASLGDPSGQNAGESYVIFGDTDGFGATLDLNGLNGTNGFRIDGVSTLDRSATSLSFAGDVNGDGFDDVIVGAHYADPNGDLSAGSAYVVFGSASGFSADLDLSSLNGENGFRLDGVDPDDRAGFTATAAGDVNGDGFDDIMVGAWNADSAAGSVYVVYGRAPTSAVTRTGAAGDQTIRGGAFDDTLDGAGGDDFLYGEAGNDTLIGGADSDEAYGGDGDDTLTGGGATDVLFGEDDNDILIGGAGADLLIGGDGDDICEGGAIADSMTGGAGYDRLTYYSSSAGVTVSLTDGVGMGGDAQGDTFSLFEAVTGSDFNDLLVGSSVANSLEGGLGDDVLWGRAGADILNGGSGSDTASYAGSSSFVRIRLFAGTAEFGDAAGDVLTGIENLVGSSFNDTLNGDVQNNSIEGGAGADTMGGREGFDTLSYASSTSRVVVNIVNNTASQGDAAGDVISGFEGLIGSAHNDILNGGVGDQTIEGGLGNDQMNAGAGFDTLSYRLATTGVTVSLLTGTATGMGNDTIVGFERVIGSAFADSLTGDGLDNVLIGGLGADALNGGGGRDRADYSASAAAVSVSLATGTGSGGDAAGDTLSGIEALTGSAFNDALTGGSGDDSLAGGAGADVLAGGGGLDWAEYAGSGSGVTVNLGAGTASGGDAAGDALSEIENILGSAQADILIGDLNANVFEGGAGADVLDGEGGEDTVSYATSNSAVSINLTTGVGLYGHAAGDVVSDMEHVIGSAFNDLIRGSSVANRLEGGAGSDALRGLDGDDALIGGVGNDGLYGGSGADTFIFLGTGLGNDRIYDFSLAGGDIIELDGSVFTDFADVMSATTDVGGSAVISRGGTSITINGVLKAQLTSGDFQFAAPATANPVGKIQADEQPLVLPAGLDAKGLADDAVIVCPPGEAAEGLALARPVLDLQELGLSDFMGRDPHRFLMENQPNDWII